MINGWPTPALQVAAGGGNVGAMGALDGLRVVSFEARRAEELATMLARHGADVVRAPALRETPLAPGPEGHFRWRWKAVKETGRRI